MGSPEAADIAALTEQIAEIFTNRCEPPLPGVHQCYRPAIMISIIRNTKLYRENFERQSTHFQKYRTIIEAIKPLVKKRRGELANFVQQLKALRAKIDRADHIPAEGLVREVDEPATDIQDALSRWLQQDLESLEAFEGLERALLRFAPPIGQRKGSWWHAAACKLAETVQLTMEEIHARAKKKPKISFQKHGRLILVVKDLLKLATGDNFKPAAIAAALEKAMTRITN
jgi:hypothetical protein